MRLTSICFGRFVPWTRVPGAVWSGKQRKIPRLTHGRMSAFLDHMLLCEQNHQYLKNPCISSEVEAATLGDERRRELALEDQVFYDRYAEQFHRRFVSRHVQDTWTRLINSKRFDL
ncbi:hypothetical protein PHET_11498 [Paragonimus heterotremus]|uniref:Uncharacterized protein n=1 Tax=Paragonimus heterotremus TaxID=100268 RepID=A0A8J4SSZ8_9TREM|nr:hypothetical protein PHET_11498 [Paragonimus heterotremus]